MLAPKNKLIQDSQSPEGPLSICKIQRLHQFHCGGQHKEDKLPQTRVTQLKTPERKLGATRASLPYFIPSVSLRTRQMHLKLTLNPIQSANMLQVSQHQQSWQVCFNLPVWPVNANRLASFRITIHCVPIGSTHPRIFSHSKICHDLSVGIM